MKGEKYMNNFKKYINKFLDKKFIIISAVLGIGFAISFFLYSKDENKLTQEEIMANIFVEDDEEKQDIGVNLEVSDKEDDKPKIAVEIKGEVIKPDVYVLDEGSLIKDLIDLAGGPTENAYMDNINRAQILNNQDCIYIYNKNEENANINNISNAQINTTKGNENMDGKININSATLEQLKELQGIGDQKAKEIINYRDENNGFKSIEDLKNVKGIGEKTFENIKDSICAQKNDEFYGKVLIVIKQKKSS